MQHSRNMTSGGRGSASRLIWLGLALGAVVAGDGAAQLFTAGSTTTSRTLTRTSSTSTTLTRTTTTSISSRNLIRTNKTNYAASLRYKGFVDTDLRFDEWFPNDHTVTLRFMAQYPRAYKGPLLTRGLGSGSYEVGLGDYSSGGIKRTKLFVRIGSSKAYFVPFQNIVPGQWNFLAMVRSGDEVRLYFNGEVLVPYDGSGPFTIAPASMLNPSASAKLRFGRKPTGYDQQFYGLLDDVAIYKYAASESQIEAMRAGMLRVTGSEFALHAAYTFDDYTPAGGILPASMSRTANIVSPALRTIVSQDRNSSVDQGYLGAPVQNTTFDLPFDTGTHWKIAQGYCGTASHHGYAAFCRDYACTNATTQGQPIRAAAGGTYSYAKAGFTNPDGYSFGIQFDPETVAAYLHMDGASILEAINQHGGSMQFNTVMEPPLVLNAAPSVNRGEKIAEVGPHSNGAHLHLDTNDGDTLFPVAMSQYEYYVGGSWYPLASGMPEKGDIVRRRYRW